MRKVAERLGTGAMSLYRYVPSKAELLDLMLDTIHGEDPPPEQRRSVAPAAASRRAQHAAR